MLLLLRNAPPPPNFQFHVLSHAQTTAFVTIVCHGDKHSDSDHGLVMPHNTSSHEPLQDSILAKNILRAIASKTTSQPLIIDENDCNS